MENKAYMVANPMTPCKCVIIDPELCTACHQCVMCAGLTCLFPILRRVSRPLCYTPMNVGSAAIVWNTALCRVPSGWNIH